MKEKLVKIGAKSVARVGYVSLRVAKVVMSNQLFTKSVTMIGGLRL